MSESKWNVGETYKLRDGSEAVVLGEHKGRLFGRVKIGSRWTASDWRADTGFWGDSPLDGLTSSYDLMPPPAPRFTRTVWLNIYPDGDAYTSQSRQDSDCGRGHEAVACVCINIDIPEGYGLDKDQPPILVRAG